LKAYVRHIALYGSETWIIRDAERRRLEAIQVWCCRRMMRIVCVDKVTNEEILQELEGSLWKNLVNRRDEMIGHLLRHDGILKTVKEGRIEENCRVSPRLAYIKQIMKAVGCTPYVEVKRKAQRREIEGCRARNNLQFNDEKKNPPLESNLSQMKPIGTPDAVFVSNFSSLS
jgi:hypothetical protein